VERDFSFLMPSDIVFEKISKAVAGLALDSLRSLVPVEVFRGGKIPAGQNSILLRATFQSAERTLREDEVAQWSAKIVETLKALGGSQRA
jgi:phenylalanyl-tRNA synthetase beta chain